MIEIIKYPNHFRGIEISLNLFYATIKIKLTGYRTYRKVWWER